MRAKEEEETCLASLRHFPAIVSKTTSSPIFPRISYSQIFFFQPFRNQIDRRLFSAARGNVWLARRRSYTPAPDHLNCWWEGRRRRRAREPLMSTTTCSEASTGDRDDHARQPQPNRLQSGSTPADDPCETYSESKTTTTTRAEEEEIKKKPKTNKEQRDVKDARGRQLRGNRIHHRSIGRRHYHNTQT